MRHLQGDETAGNAQASVAAGWALAQAALTAGQLRALRDEASVESARNDAALALLDAAVRAAADRSESVRAWLSAPPVHPNCLEEPCEH